MMSLLFNCVGVCPRLVLHSYKTLGIASEETICATHESVCGFDPGLRFCATVLYSTSILPVFHCILLCYIPFYCYNSPFCFYSTSFYCFVLYSTVFRYATCLRRSPTLVTLLNHTRSPKASM